MGRGPVGAEAELSIAPESADAAGATGSCAGGCGAGAGTGRAAGPGFTAGVSLVGAGAAGASLAAGAGAGAEGRGPGRGPLPAGFAAGRADVEGPADPAGPGRAPDLPLPLVGADFDVTDSRRRRATGASTVEDADFTNSPCSLSFASSSLLVTPSSLANSCTRALPATALLTERSSSTAVEGTGARTTSGYLRWTFIAGTSRCAHECSCLFSR